MNRRTHKFRRPLAHRCVLRTSLFERLTDVAAMPVTAVLAPPGYGKTTLISSYIESTEQGSIWYCVDESDADLAGFFHYFGQAIRDATPKSRKPLPQFQAVDAMNARVYARRFFSAAYQRLGRAFAIVFDDLHECCSQGWGDVVRIAIEELPEWGRIFLISRQPLPPELARLNLNQNITYVREDDLRFSDHEVIDLAASHAAVMSDEQLRQAKQVMAGWVAGLALLFSRAHHADDGVLFAIDTKMELFNYFGNEVLRCVDEPVRELLFRTCFLPEVSVQQAVELTGSAEAEKLLTQLYESNYFTYRLAGSSATYRYHPMFKDFLKEQSAKQLDIDMLRETKEVSVTLLEQEGAIEAACALLIDLQNWQRLAQLIIKYANSMVVDNRFRTLSAWLLAMPAAVVAENGWLLYWRAMCDLIIQPKRARADFVRGYELFSSDAQAVGQVLTLAGIMDSYTIERDDFKPLDRWIAEVDRLEPLLYDNAPDSAQTLPDEALAILTVSMFNALLHRAPHHPNYAGWLQRLENIQMSQLPPGLRITKQKAMILHSIWSGDFRSAEIHHDLLAQKLSQSEEALPRIFWHLMDCCYLWCATEKGRQALATAKQGLKVTKEYGLTLWDIGLLSHGAAAALVMRNSDEAGPLLSAAAKHADDSRRSNLSFYHMLCAMHAHQSDDIETADYHAREALRYAEISGAPFYQAAAHLNRGLLRFAQDDVGAARAHLDQLSVIAQGIGSHYHCFNHDMFKAILEWHEGERASALGCLESALARAKRYRILPGLWVHDEAIAELLGVAMRDNIEAEYARVIVAKRNLMPASAPYHIESWPWPIRIRTLGQFEILIEGRPLKPANRSRPKVIALLKALIAFGGRQVREELISEAVWPDSDGDAAHQLFTTTLFRLRKMVGIHEAFINREGRLSLNERFCWLDAWAFEAGCEQLGLLLSGTGENQAGAGQIKTQFERLRDSYRGDFLQSEEMLWVVVRQRQQLCSKWVQLLYRLAGYWQQQHCVYDAEQVLATVINVNPLEEKAYRMLMALYISQGRLSDAATVYDACRSTLKAGLNVKPSLETEKVYQKIQLV